MVIQRDQGLPGLLARGRIRTHQVGQQGRNVGVQKVFHNDVVADHRLVGAVIAVDVLVAMLIANHAGNLFLCGLFLVTAEAVAASLRASGRRNRLPPAS